jgi:hypothetical protein
MEGWLFSILMFVSVLAFLLKVASSHGRRKIGTGSRGRSSDKYYRSKKYDDSGGVYDSDGKRIK